MFRLFAAIAALIVIGPTIAAEPAVLTMGEADSRLRHTYELARETNDSATVDRVLELRDLVRRAFSRKDIAAAQRLVRDAEEAVGLEAGGTLMLRLPVGRINPHQRKKLEAIEERLVAASNGGDEKAITAIAAEYAKLLGENAGLPDVRRRGETAKAMPIKPAEVADVFVKVIEADSRTIKTLSAGVPGSDTLPRTYAAIVAGCLAIRPSIEKHFKDKLGAIDALVRGCCKAMMLLQAKSGYFKFPDIRGQNLVLGDAIERLVENDTDAIQDGWVVKPFADGMSQIDAAECGMALLQSGALYKNLEWTQAGLAAATWSKNTPLSANFIHNAYSVSLLCTASKVKPEAMFDDVAWQKFRQGVVFAQTEGGRLIDPRCARTVNHFVLIRAIHDVLEALPPKSGNELTYRAARSAMKSVLDEADKLGAPVTGLTVQELGRHLRLIKDSDARVRPLLEESGTATVKRCTQGGRVRAAAPLPELAAVAQIWKD